MFRTCPSCGSNNDPGERCYCQMQTTVLLTFSDGNEILTRINGSQESIIDYYRKNNALTYTGGDPWRPPDPHITSVKFVGTDRLVPLGPNGELLEVKA